MTMQPLVRKWRSWRRLSPSLRHGFLPTWFLLGASRLAVLSLPFSWVSRHLGKIDGARALLPLTTREQAEAARSVARMIALTVRYCPWDANCLAQALTACWWLRRQRIPYAAFLGILKDEQQQMRAHAWVCSGAVNVCGGACFSQYTVVASFVSDTIAPQT